MTQPVLSLSRPGNELRDSKARFRSDLQVSRQQYRGAPVYVVHDPVTFQTHRLDFQQYQIAARLDGSEVLGSVFADLVRRNQLHDSDETAFYEFITRLYQSGLAVLPVHNGAQLFDRHEKAAAAKRSKRWMSVLFLQIPLVNPDRFLDRTVGHVAWLFSRASFYVWAGLALLAGLVVIARFGDLIEPLNGILSPSNLPLLWLTLLGLKLWHELGHAYACKVFGASVPEMGAYLIAGNPLAYVDATSAWGIPQRWRRLVIMAGGMYFESLIAIPAVFVWASSSGFVNAMAFQILFAASLVTVLFNANPLMKFDGYFILCELLRQPNLRSRAADRINRCLQRAVLGRPSAAEPDVETPAESIGLLVYGVASAFYKAFLVLSIATGVAMRFPLVGLAIGAAYVASSAGGSARKVWKFLAEQDASPAIKLRARVASLCLFLGTPLAAAILPVPFPVVSWGVVGAESEQFVRVDTPGEYSGATLRPGQPVQPGESLAELENVSVSDRLVESHAALREANLKWEVLADRDIVESTRLAGSIEALQRQLEEVERQQRMLSIRASGGGVVLRTLPDTQRGRFLKTGDAVGLIADGRPLLRAWLTQEQLDSISPTAGTRVRFRIPGRSTETFHGLLSGIEMAADSVVHERALSTAVGGDLLIDPRTGQSAEALFRVDVIPTGNAVSIRDHGGRVVLAIPRRYQSVGWWAVNKVTRFVQQLWLA